MVHQELHYHTQLSKYFSAALRLCRDLVTLAPWVQDVEAELPLVLIYTP